MFKINREKFSKKLKKSSIAIFFSKDKIMKNDGEYFDFCDVNLFYLSGIEQANTKLVLIKDELGKFHEYLFIKKTDEVIRIWEGEKLSISEAKQISGIENILFEDKFENFIKEVFENSNFNNLYVLKTKNDEFEFRTTQYQEFLNNLQNIIETSNQKKKTKIINSYSILETLREIKSVFEISQIKKALQVTNFALLEVLKQLKSIKNEKEIEAILTYIYIKNNCKHAFQPIVATGRNACILHYLKNDANLLENQLVLIDTGAELANYEADMSRTYPVSGKFTPRQKLVYSACLDIQKYAISILKPGNFKVDREKEIYAYAAKKLMTLNLFTKEEFEKDNTIAKQYLLHSSGHFLGLDTHDVGSYDEPFKENQILTVEPGIYIENEGIGVRIEDVVRITKNGCEVLSKDIVKEIEDIEDIMRRC